MRNERAFDVHQKWWRVFYLFFYQLTERRRAHKVALHVYFVLCHAPSPFFSRVICAPLLVVFVSFRALHMNTRLVGPLRGDGTFFNSTKAANRSIGTTIHKIGLKLLAGRISAFTGYLKNSNFKDYFMQ
jgi:hypothetical protein